jgi:hypothetical protein
MRRFVAGCLFVLVFAGRLPAQSFTTSQCDSDEGNTNNHAWFGHQDRACELRRTTLPVINGQLSLSGKNDGIEVIGESARMSPWKRGLLRRTQTATQRCRSYARSRSSPLVPSTPRDQRCGDCLAVAGMSTTDCTCLAIWLPSCTRRTEASQSPTLMALSMPIPPTAVSS